MRMYDIHLSAIIAKSTNRLLNPNRFCVDKFQKIYLYKWLPHSTQISTNYTTSIQLVLVLTSIQSYLLKGNRFTLCSCGPRVQGIGSQLSPYRSSLYCQTVKLCGTTGTVAKPQALKSILVFWFQHESCAIAISGFLTEWPSDVRTLISYPLRKGYEYRSCLQENRFPLPLPLPSRPCWDKDLLLLFKKTHFVCEKFIKLQTLASLR